jgi:transposase-like protein
MHFNSVKKRYDAFRKEIIAYEEEQYQNNAHRVNEYDEYLYLPKSLKIFEKNMHKVQNFLTLAYGESVYTIMMPKIQSYDYNLSTDTENKKLYKFLKFNKVAKLSTTQNSITKFWDFFETYITRYKGIKSEQFVYYLKEIEFRFNFTCKQQHEILWQRCRDNLGV